ncbi:relaxase/mobilization nuclease domain-containing protein [Helicobacter bilis]|uniref:relaxase/mobilization nuclease domain-containing protein n=1 Tax=Helicobacter bilis TaxID=37372 RepID=UPI000CF0C0E5
MVFSMRDYDDCDAVSLKNAAFETIKNLYPNAHFVLAFHNDTDNPHCHICLKATNNDGSRIDIKKADCTTIRKTFAENLNKRGVYALATRKQDSIRGRQLANNITEALEPKTLHEYNAKPHYYKILDFGEAPYNDDNLNDMSYFVRYYTRKGNITIWEQNLRQIVEESKLQKGEYARISKVGYELRPYQFDKTIKGKVYTIGTARKVAKWDISIMNRAEKAFTKLPKVKITTTMKPKGVDSISSTKRYTKQEWAAYYANKKGKSMNQEYIQESSGQDTTQGVETLKQNSTQQEMPLYTSPTLLLLEIHPNPMPICAECPKAMWHLAKNMEERTIRCFCQVMHSIVYQDPQIQGQNPKSETIIENCDGQLVAIQELVESEIL